MVRVTSLQALNSQALNPKKGPLLQAQLPALLEGLYHEEEESLLAAMATVTRVARSLGQKGLETFRPDIALTLGPYINDERARVRASALEMLSAVAHGGVGEKQTGLRQELIRHILPVLVHMRDEDAAVRKVSHSLTVVPALPRPLPFSPSPATWPLHLADWHLALFLQKARATFFCLAHSLGWKEIKSVSRKLMGEQGLRVASYSIWSYMMKTPKDSRQIFMSQALDYTNSPQPGVRAAAVLFLAHTTYYSRGEAWLSADVLHFLSQTFQRLRTDL
ncbi:maestro heat-like repeat family member 5 isoform X1 [Ornithorhynchus anatinus]|uniref:maestro heat-like repeat family member 5 isoform X1 n=1 Tax=Ornithorhynchus anatinus TaxID=9258 RepID=UPI0019D48701|nr:maestro heat-like repeat family member 5 isoform X1 [Ornithorhynchus anatinus]